MAGCSVAEALEGIAGEEEALDVGVGDNGGGARGAVDQGHLAEGHAGEKVARRRRAAPAPTKTLTRPAGEEEELAGLGSGLDEDGTGGPVPRVTSWARTSSWSGGMRRRARIRGGRRCGRRRDEAEFLEKAVLAKLEGGIVLGEGEEAGAASGRAWHGRRARGGGAVDVGEDDGLALGGELQGQFV